jgi:hypothetical protein
MGTGASREGRLESDSEDDDGQESSPRTPSSERSFSFHNADMRTPSPSSQREQGYSTPDPTIHLRMGSLTLDGPPRLLKAKLYQYIQGKWLTTAKNVGWQYVRESDDDADDDDEDEEWRSSTVGHKNYKFWMFEVAGVRARVDDHLQMHFYADQLRVDFVAKGVWALKFPSKDQFQACVAEYEDAK